jgi:hypothetical protein
MKVPLCFIVLSAILICACKQTGSRISDTDVCQGQGIWEFIRTADGSAGSFFFPMYTVRCSGICPDGTACDTIIEQLPGFNNKRIWCGCKGDLKPRACDVIFEQIDTFERFICTPLLEGCPGKNDSCILVMRTVMDTIKSIATQSDSLYREQQVYTCECLNRGPV